ncbi:MAG: ATP synthase F1 subunit epsilon [Endomicrobium sp.]|jgi:F-type H+-transporting ATPase subunit epsilon|nr:ATP synthase F1 subunit epsilon [Endomicrobium sp.]
MKELQIEILSPNGVIFNGKILSVSFPTVNGIISVFPGHTNLVTKLNNGEIIITEYKKNNIKNISVSGGFIEIAQNNITVIAEFALQSNETNKQKIKQAIELAKNMKNKRQKLIDMSIIESQLQKSTGGLKLGLEIKRKKI